MNATRLVVFDLDGTLIDSRRDLTDSANALIVERGRRHLDLDDRVVAVRMPARAIVAEQPMAIAEVDPLRD